MNRSGTGDVPGDRAAITRDRVAARAYELYVARGQENGHDLADWLQAEAELHRQPVESAASAASTEAALRPRLVRARRPETLGG
jgi:hypothetical protein